MSKLKTTGKPRQFDTGAQRDNADNKLRMSLVPHAALNGVMLRYIKELIPMVRIIGRKA